MADRKFLKVLQIIPDDPGGVHDHAAILTDEFRRHGLASATLEGREFRNGASADYGNNVVILVHLSAYGYARYGLCFWLPGLLARLKRRRPELRIVTLFHEVATNGPITTTAFWSSFGQKAISARMAAFSDAVVTNSSLHARRLRAIGVRREVVFWPVFSNVGELSINPEFHSRADRIILFGGESVRRWAIQQLSWKGWQSIGALGPIVEVGTGRRILDRARGAEWLGAMASEDLSHLLGRTKYGLAGHGSGSLSKSGTFAAYAAHGCVPLVSASSVGDHDGLFSGIHYLESETAGSVELACASRISQNTWTWYKSHDIAIQGERFANLIRSVRN